MTKLQQSLKRKEPTYNASHFKFIKKEYMNHVKKLRATELNDVDG